MSAELIEHIQDLLRGTRWDGRLRFRAMFGGHGVYGDGRFCAIVIDDGLYLKADEQNLPLFVARGLKPFVYQMKGQELEMSYYQAPAEALEDGTELADWIDGAWAAAGRKAARKAVRKPRPRKKKRR